MVRPARVSIVLLVLALATSAACSDSGDDSDAASGRTGSAESTTSSTVALPEPTLEPRDCAPEVAAGVTYDCHWLVVPANRAEFDGTTYRLEVTVLHSPNPDPRPDPVIYLSGGPGYPGGSTSYWSSTPLIQERDVIVWDQRGTGDSEPDLECSEMEAVVLESFSDDRPYEDEQQEMVDAVSACHDRLVDRGIDLRGFSTVENAADLADLRVALGYDEWNLFGISYGTRLALETMRSHPEGIRSVILDSTYPMDKNSVTSVVEGAQRAFDQLAAGCAADPACAAAHGDLTQVFEGIIAQYDAEPYRSTIDLGPDAGGVIPIVVTGSDIVAGLFNAMYDTTLIPALPAFATTLTSGDASIIDTVALQGIPNINAVSEGMAISVDCSDAAAGSDEDAGSDVDLLADPGRWSSMLTVLTPEFCEIWTVGELDRSFAEPVTSDIPTIVLSGTYDPVTPTPGGAQVAEALGAPFVTFDGFGHGVWSESECGTSITLAFLADPTSEVDTSCAEEVGPPAFL
jgi:pimeloyl-ACP methyl ester carboxylesterase